MTDDQNGSVEHAAEWWPDEMATAGDEHLDPVYVAGYDRKSGVDPTPDVEALVGLGLDRSSTLLDLGAGTGVFSLAASQIAGRVIAVDVSPAMIEALRARLVADEVGNVRVERAGFLSYRHRGAPVDFVHSRHALHQLPDLWKVVALDRIAGWLRPGGVLLLRDLVVDVEPDRMTVVAEQWMGAAADDPATGYTADEFAEHLRNEYSTFTWLLEPMLERAGFEIVEREVRASIYARYVCRRRTDVTRPG